MIAPRRWGNEATEGRDSPRGHTWELGLSPPWGLNSDAQDPPLPLNDLDHPSQRPDAFCPQGPSLHTHHSALQLQACSLGGGDSLSRPQPQPLLLTPTPAAGISAQMARPRATLFAYFLFCPDPETLPSSRWAHGSSFSLPSQEPRLQVSGLLPPLPADGPRQLRTHWATGGGGIWSQGEVRESPPFPGRPA